MGIVWETEHWLLWIQAFLYLPYSKESEAVLELAKTVAQQVINNSLRHRLQAARSMSDNGADTTAGDTSVANQSSARTAASITTTSSAGESVSQKLQHFLCVSQSYTGQSMISFSIP